MASGLWILSGALGLGLSVPVGLYLCANLFPNEMKLAKKKSAAWICSKMMWRVHRNCAQQKIMLFKNFDIESKRDGPVPHILEVGVGSGNNLAFLPKRCTLSCLDPNLEHQQYVLQALQPYPDIRLDKFVKGFAEDMKEIDDNTFDAVICTFTLCSVRQLGKAISEIKRVLKPGGSFFFMEHVAAPRSSVLRSVQEWLQVVWPTVSDGCNLTRETWTDVEEAGFSSVQLQHFIMPGTKLLAVVNCCVFGVAVK